MSFSAFVLVFSLFILGCLSSASAAWEFTELNDYQMWAVNEGYPQGLLLPLGISGINQDYFHSNPNFPGYSSGKIVIGDSRSCQLGIYQSRTGADDYAVFAVWGGHYIPGTGTPIFSGNLLSDFEQCFREQIRTHGSCTVFFFATINDYDYFGNDNSAYISAAVSSAEMIASMSYEYEGTVYHPRVILIGIEGSGDSFGVPDGSFNRYIGDYNTKLKEAVNQSTILKGTATFFTTVPEITGGGTTFISDGLHYSDAALQKIAGFIYQFSGEE